MGAKSSIEWTNATWNFLIGCTKCSQGCAHCYFMEEHARRHKAWKDGWKEAPKQYHLPPTVLQFFPERLGYPLTWRDPRLIFLDSQSDLFHPDVRVEWIAAAFGVMALAGHHTFQVLTKRPERMREIVGKLTMEHCMAALSMVTPGVRLPPVKQQRNIAAWMRAKGRDPDAETWPLPNVWLGTSVEDQAAADSRIPHLMRTAAAVRFLSCEPLIGAVKLMGSRLDWVICGGESGPQARPMHPQWARDLRDECISAGIPYFFKQWGEWSPRSLLTIDGKPYGGGTDFVALDPRCEKWTRVIRLGEHGKNTRISENCTPDMGEETFVQFVGKKLAGRILDGREWNEMPVQGASV